MTAAVAISLGLFLGSLPVWRSGEQRGLTGFEFIAEHTILSSKRQWINLEDKQTHEKIWVELEEGRPKSKLLYQNSHKGNLIGYVKQHNSNHQFQQVSDIQGKVRRDGQYYSLKFFITPEEPLIRDLAAILYQGGDFVKDAQDFVHSEVKYKSDIGDFWQTPLETLAGRGDCEDTSLLLCSILKNYTDSYVVLGSWKNQGHAWLISGEPWHIIESTANPRKPVKEKGYLPQLFFNNEQVWISSQSDFDFLVIKDYPQFNLR